MPLSSNHLSMASVSPAYSNSKIIALEDISIYTEAEDMPLKEVFKRFLLKKMENLH